MTLSEFNYLSEARAVEELLRCCGSSAWARKVAGFRPFVNADELERTSTDIWWALGEKDWREAFSHHPRIGERAKASGWARDEQAGTKGAASDVLEQLTRRNKDYEDRFGHVFLIYASGKSAEEMLSALESRMSNTAKVETRIAAGEQAKITKLRLERLIDGSRITDHGLRK